MSRAGSPPASRLSGLPPVERRAALALRLWREGPDGRFAMERELAEGLGTDGAARACAAFDALLLGMARAARRPMRLGPSRCRIATTDEAALGRAVAAAATGDHAAAARLLAGLLDAPAPEGAVAQAEAFGLLVHAAQRLRFPGLPAAGAGILD